MAHFNYRQMNKIEYYTVSPRIVKANGVATLTVKNKYITGYPHFTLEGSYQVLVSPMLDFEVESRSGKEQNPVTVEAVEGALTFSHSFAGEQDYMLMIWKTGENGEKETLLTTFLYALNADLYERIPLRGNTHLHSAYSDGLEEPLQHIGAALKHGFDYIALTDHNNYEGSTVAQNYVKELSRGGIDKQLTVLNGEEFSCNFQPMHIISLGAREAVPAAYYLLSEIPTIENAEERLAWLVEQLVRLADKIHELGGLVVLCHPYRKPIFDWVRIDAPHSLIKAFINSGVVDAFEVVGGSPKGMGIIPQEQHLLALECMRTAPRPYAFLGQSDSHVVNTDDESCTFGAHYTVAFAKENTREGILEAVRSRMTVAARYDGKQTEYFGELRLVNFCRFLEKAYFPQVKQRKRLYFEAYERYATGRFDEGDLLCKALGKISAFSYEDLK